jgi:hypothetical protein
MRSLVAQGDPWSTSPCAGVLRRFGPPRLADLHPVLVLTTRRLATTPSPPSRPHPGLVGSSQGRSSGMGVPQFQHTRPEQPVAASSTPGGFGDTAGHRADLTGPPPSHVGSGVSQPPCTPRFSRRFQRRFLASASVAGLEPSAARGWATAALCFAGFRPQWVPTIDARCIVLIPLSR